MIGVIVRDLWASRELLHQLVQRDLRLRYRQAVMGFAWAIFLPALTIGAGLIIRSLVTRAGAAGSELSLGGIAIKSWGWAFFAGAMNFATASLLANIQLVTKIYFPREVLPLASIVAQGFDSLLALGVLLLLGPWIGFHWSAALLWVPYLVLLLVLLTTGLALLFACANVFFRDVKYILQVLLMFGIFFTPVLVEPAMVSVRAGQLLMLNPLGPILEGLRLVLVDGRSLGGAITAADGRAVWLPWQLGYASAVAFLVLIAGMVAFRRSAVAFAEYY